MDVQHRVEHSLLDMRVCFAGSLPWIRGKTEMFSSKVLSNVFSRPRRRRLDSESLAAAL